MKNRFSLLARSLALAAGLALASLATASAQAPGSTGPTPGAPQADPTAVPLDGGAALLLAAGIGLGLRRLCQKRAAKTPLV